MGQIAGAIVLATNAVFFSMAPAQSISVNTHTMASLLR